MMRFFSWDLFLVFLATLAMWYFGGYAFAADRGPTMASSRKFQRVAVIDTGLDPADPRFSPVICKDHTPWDFSKDAPVIYDPIGHGTHIAGTIRALGGDEGYCLLIYRYYSANDTGKANLANEIRSIRRAVQEGATLINISGGGDEPEEAERVALMDAQVHGATVFVAAGNEASDIVSRPYYPASYEIPAVHPVGALMNHGNLVGPERTRRSNWGGRVHDWEVGENVYASLPAGFGACAGYLSGTSMATAIATGRELRDRVGLPLVGHDAVPDFLYLYWKPIPCSR